MLYKGDTLYLTGWKMALPNWYLMGSVNKLDTATVASLGEAIGVLEQQSDLKGCCCVRTKQQLYRRC